MIKRCKLPNGNEFLCWTHQDQIEFPEGIEILDDEITELALQPEYHDLPIVQLEQMQARFVGYHVRVPDVKLEEQNISTFNDLKYAYYLIKTKESNIPRSIRDLVEKKYQDVLYA